MDFKKRTFTLLTGLLSTLSIMAQYADNSQYNYVNPDSKKITTTTNSILSFGFGVGGNYPYSGITYVENPNITLSYENTTFKHVGPGSINLGELLSYENIYSGYTDYGTGYNYVQHWSYYILGTRISYHLNPFPTNKNIELYAGAMFGYYITTFKVTSTDPDYSEPGDPGYYLTPDNYPDFIALSTFVGARSWFNSHGSVWLEVGYGYTSLAFGVSYKI
jgi:hypothetical protein